MRCVCVQAGRSCLNCLPSKRGRCSNNPTAEQASSDCVVGDTSHTRVSVDLPPPDGEMFNSTPTVPELVRSHFQNAFGAPLLHSEGGPRVDVWCKLWLRIVSFRNCHYDLPSGTISHDFIELLSSEVSLLARGLVKSEWVLVFLSAMLQRDPMVRRGTDIRRLLSRRLKDWRGEKFNSLVCEAERCARQFVGPRRKDEKDYAIALFTCV